jgi:ATP-dependent DNA helicase RecG
MNTPTFEELWQELCSADESVEIEAKRAEEIGKSVLSTISAFANEPERAGGFLLLGVARRENALFPDYEIVGVRNPDRIQADLATQCREVFSAPIRPEIRVDQYESKTVIVVHIPEAPDHDKPVYIKSKGLPKGAFRRVGSTDQACTDDDIAMFYQARGQRSYDESPLPDTLIEDVDPRAIQEYRRLRVEAGTESELVTYPDEDLLYALGATTQADGRTCLTVAGLVVFGKNAALRRHLPMTRVDYIRVEGREWVPDPEKRYQSIEKLGPLIFTVPTLISQILEDIPKAFTLADDGLRRRDVPLVPRKVIREALVNALMHRSFQRHQPVQIIRYANRIELKNPGYSLVPDERLGEPGSKTRNPKIAAILHDVGFAETKGTGIRAMREAMEQANLSQPLFESDRERDEFTVRLLVVHLLSPTDWEWLSQFQDCNLGNDDARALVVLRELGAIDNAVYRSVNHVDTLTASGRLRHLRDAALLEQHGKGAGSYYLPAARFLAALGVQTEPEPLRAQSVPLRAGFDALRAGFDPLRAEFEALRAELPEPLRAHLCKLGQRSTPEELDATLMGLCAWRPLSLGELAALTAKTPNHLRSRNIKRLLTDGRLQYLHPEEPSHPDQKYVAAKPEGAS